MSDRSQAVRLQTRQDDVGPCEQLRNRSVRGRESLGVDDGRLGWPHDTDHGKHVVRLDQFDAQLIVSISSWPAPTAQRALTELIADLGRHARVATAEEAARAKRSGRTSGLRLRTPPTTSLWTPPTT